MKRKKYNLTLNRVKARKATVNRRKRHIESIREVEGDIPEHSTPSKKRFMLCDTNSQSFLLSPIKKLTDQHDDKENMRPQAYISSRLSDISCLDHEHDDMLCDRCGKTILDGQTTVSVYRI